MHQWKERRWKEVRGSGLYPGQWNNISSGMSLRDGFWTDVKELLLPSPQLTDPNVGDMSDKPLLANGIRPEVEDHKCESLGKEVTIRTGEGLGKEAWGRKFSKEHNKSRPTIDRNCSKVLQHKHKVTLT